MKLKAITRDLIKRLEKSTSSIDELLLDCKIVIIAQRRKIAELKYRQKQRHAEKVTSNAVILTALQDVLKEPDLKVRWQSIQELVDILNNELAPEE